MCYNNSDDSQKGIEFMYQNELLLVEKFVNIQFLVQKNTSTLDKIDWTKKTHQQLKNLSLLLNNSWHQYEFGCDLKVMKTNESGLPFTNLIEHVEKQLIAAQIDVEDIKDET